MVKMNTILLLAIVSLAAVSIITDGLPNVIYMDHAASGLDINSSSQRSSYEEEPSFSEPITATEGSVIVNLSGQSMPLKTYQNSLGNYFWIENAQEWAQYASIPQCTQISLIAYTSDGGQGEVFEIYSSGMMQKKLYKFNQGYTDIRFLGDISGVHVLFFIVNKQLSNGIIINVGSAWKVLGNISDS